MTDIRDATLLDDLLRLELQGQVVDLRNDFQLDKISLNEKELTFSLINPRTEQLVTILFDDVVVRLLDIALKHDVKIMNAFYRGRFQQGRKLLSYDDAGRKFFYIGFADGSEVRLWARGGVVKLA